MNRLTAIDPGNRASAYVVIDVDTRRPVEFAKLPNADVRDRLYDLDDCSGTLAIEMVASYGMAVGADVFETCVQAGRFIQIASQVGQAVERVYRREIKLHHCGSARAKDSNIIQALIDRFAPDVRNRGKGTKAEPGFFYGFAADVWQSYALAVYVADQMSGHQP